jgi:hypothetical protein
VTAQQHPDPAVSGQTPDERHRRLGKRVGTVLSGTVLVIGNMATLFFTVVAWLMMPAGIGDSNLIEGAWFNAFAGTVLALVTALLTILTVMARWLGKRWFIVPAVLFVVATARWVYIGAAYPEPIDRYGYGSAQVTVVDAPAVDAVAMRVHRRPIGPCFAWLRWPFLRFSGTVRLTGPAPGRGKRGPMCELGMVKGSTSRPRPRSEGMAPNGAASAAGVIVVWSLLVVCRGG